MLAFLTFEVISYMVKKRMIHYDYSQVGFLHAGALYSANI